MPRLRLRPISSLALLFAFSSSSALAQSGTWTADYVLDRAAVSLQDVDTTWTRHAVQAMWSQPERGGWLFAVEHNERGSTADVTLSSRAYWRAGDWTLLVGGGATPQADFFYRGSVEGELSYRAVGPLVVSGGYRYLAFPGADIHQLQPALTWYLPRGEIEGRAFVTRNVTGSRTTGAVLLRSSYAVSARVRLQGGASFGDRIFDVAALPAGSAESRVGFAGVRIGLSAHDFIDIGGTTAREHPAFTYRALTLGYRRSF